MDVTLPAQASSVGLARRQSAQRVQRFNFYGQLAATIDEEENVTIYEYYGADQVNGDGTRRVPGAGSATGGYLRRIHRDSQYGAGRQSGQNPTPMGRKTVFEYGPQDSGRVRGNLLGIPTSILNGRGVERIRLVNELGQIVEETRAFSTSPGLTALKYKKFSRRDANDDVLDISCTTHDPRSGARGLRAWR